MALSEKNRAALYQGLSNVVDEEAVQEMLSYFPARDVEESVTKEFMRAEMSDFKAEMRADMADFKAEMRADMADFKAEMRADMAAMQLRLIRWNVGTLITFSAVLIAAVRL